MDDSAEARQCDPVSIDPSQRRPIRTRDARWAASLAERLANAGLTPNAISLAGMLGAMGAGIVLGLTSQVGPIGMRLLFILAAVLIQFRLLCNMFDGMVAVSRDLCSKTGQLWNEVPDRVSDAMILIGAGYAVGGEPTLGFGAAVVALFVAYVRAAAVAAGAPQDFTGPMAKPQRMFIMTVACVYLAVMPSGWTHWPDVPWAGVMNLALAIVVLGGLWTGLRRLRRAAGALQGEDQDG